MAAAKREKPQYVGTGYPNWPHSGKPCVVIERLGKAAMLVEFDGDAAHYLVHVNDVALK